MNNRDRQSRNVQTGIPLGDRWIVPHGDVAEEDVGQDRTRQLQLARRDARNVNRRHNATDDGRKLIEAVLVKNVLRQRLVGGTEVNGFGFDLLDAAARTDGLIVELVTSGALIAFGPLGIKRCWECRASARNRVSRVRGDRCEQHRGREGCSEKLHHFSISMEIQVMPVCALYLPFMTDI